MQALTRYPPAHRTCLARLRTLSGYFGTSLPAEGLPERMPFHRAELLPGTDDGITFTARVVIDVFAPSYAVGEPRAEDCRQLLCAAPWHVVVDGQDVVADRVICTQSPVEVPWGDDNVRCWNATYQVDLRR